MDNLLIDFNSPKLCNEAAPLIPNYLVDPPLIPSTAHFPGAEEESNPFDLVVCQVAANAAAENDPFEMVLNHAISCRRSQMKEDCFKTVSPRLDMNAKSLSLPDLGQLMEHANESLIHDHTSDRCGIVDSSTARESSYPSLSSGRNELTTGGDEWTCLDDILPPDSFMNATVGMTCCFDDTSSSPIEIVDQEISDSCVLKFHKDGISVNTENLNKNEDHKATYKSENELKLLAQKQIENIINKAELKVQSDIQKSIFQKRLSFQSASKPSQEVLALCTPKKTRESLSYTSESFSSFQKWSEDELMKLDMILPGSAPKTSVAQVPACFPSSYASEKFGEEANISSEEMPFELSPLPEGNTQREQKHIPSGHEQLKLSAVVPSSHSSPVLLPLPLCEDAVRNLSLCSKFSPNSSNLLNKESRGVHSNAGVYQEQSSKQAKLILRKPVVSVKSQAKLVPMKATAPIHNMTRTRSLLITAPKSDAISIDEKENIKEAKSAVNKRYGLPQSPRLSCGGSLPNLSIQGNKLPSRLPSPRRSAVHQPMNLKQRIDASRSKNTPQVSGASSSHHSSPRPICKSSPCKSSSQPRVLADINASPSARKSPKRKVNQLELPRRARSIINEKENLLY